MQATLIAFMFISKVAVFLSIVTYVYLGQDAITARKVFVVSSFYTALHEDFVRYWATAVAVVAEGIVSLNRITKFLLIKEETIVEKKITDQKEINEEDHKVNDESEEVLLKNTNNPVIRRVTNIEGSSKSLKITNGHASWNNPDAQSHFQMSNITLECNEKALWGIVGPVGSGKSNLLNIIIGELQLTRGTIEINGTLSYASQEPWPFEGNIRQNILFVEDILEDYDEKRYALVLKVCALERDISGFPYGDLTIVGERGVCLSGGQKARINLARAVYKQADIYLLDDPLSAVDTQVGKQIFEECLKEFLGDKIVFLVTHQLKVLKDVDHVVVMNGGRVDEQGSYKAIHKNDYLKSLRLETEEAEKGDKKLATLTAHLEVKQDEEEPDEEEEACAVGAVKFETYKAYFESVKSNFYVTFIFLLFVIAQVVSTSTDFLLTRWVNWEEEMRGNGSTIHGEKEDLNGTTVDQLMDVDPIENQRQEFIIIYAVLILFTTILVVYKTFTFFKMTLRASVHLHDRLFRGIIRATV